MRKDYILFGLWTFILTCAWSYLVTEISRGLNGVGILTTLQGVSLEACKKECERRAYCTNAVYQRRSAYCVLMSASSDVHLAIPSVGAVLVNVFHPYNETGPVYGRHIRAPSQTCTRNTAGTTICGVNECGGPSPISAAVSGNLYSLGNQLLYNCGSGVKSITCGQHGVWIHHTTYVDCTEPCGVTGLYIAPQQQMYCDMHNDGGNWMVFQRRYDGSVDFFRNWTDYRDGFGDLYGEFWLGLEQIHQTVRTGSYELRIDMEDFNGTERFAKYDTFKIYGEQDNYTLVVTGYSGDCEDSLSYQSGMMFTTADADNDMFDESCAQVYRGGWWYKACHWSNLNGRYPHGAYSEEYATHIHWRTWTGYQYSLRKTEMKMRRK